MLNLSTLLALTLLLSSSPLTSAATDTRFDKVVVRSPQPQPAEETSFEVREDGNSSRSLVKRGDNGPFNGRATFFEVGQGACGGWSVDSDYVSWFFLFSLFSSFYEVASIG